MADSSTSNRGRNSNSHSSNRTSQRHEQPDLNSSNPYEILGVSPNATIQQIKLSYRKLALQYHPDRLSPDATSEEKEGAHKSFTKIGHAYEILSDEGRRQEYDVEQQQQEHQSRRGGSFFNGRDPFAMGDPFSTLFGMRNSRRHDDFHYMDPFELFNQFFSEEMNHMNGNQQYQHGNTRSRSRSAFDSDPFFGSDSFFSSGFGGSNMMSHHFGMMNEMNSMMSQMHSGSMFNNQQMINGGSSHFSSSSTSTRTTIVNGVQTTVTERTIVHPDGRVERHTETSGGGNRALPSTSARPAIGYDSRGGRRR